MHEDIKLKKRCFILFILAFVGLISMITVKFVCFSSSADVLKNETGFSIAYIVVETLIWVLSGVGASAFTLFLTKKNDYEYKRKIMITDYYYDAQALFFELIRVRPVTMRDWSLVKKTYDDFENNFGLWRKMLHNYKSMEFSNSDKNIKEAIDNVHNELLRLLNSVKMIHLTIMGSEVKPEGVELDNYNDDLFKKEPCYADKYVYTPYARITLFPLLGILEEIATGEKTMREEECPSFSTVGD